MKIPPKITTFNGMDFNLLNPEDSYISIFDIAHALSHLCRFTGHSAQFYSVAQHSVMVSEIVPAEDAMAGLLHDAAEAFVGDVAAPLKQLIPDYQKIEQRVEAAILRRFNICRPKLPKSVKNADLILLATERRDLMPPQDYEWELIKGVTPLADKINPLSPIVAKHLFLTRFQAINSAALASGRDE